MSGKPRALLRWNALLGEEYLKFRVEAFRLGQVLGLFTGGYKALMRICDLILRPKQDENPGKKTQRHWWESALCAFCCGPAVILMGKPWYNSFAMYVGTRAAQGLYNWAKARRHWHFWGSSWAHGDSLLFAAGTAQIMYAYAVRHDTLDPKYHQFIINQGPMPKLVLSAVSDNCLGKPVDVDTLMQFIEKSGGAEAAAACAEMLSSPFPRYIPSRALQPAFASPTLASLNAFWGVCKRIFPVYFGLTLVPTVVLKFGKFMKSPFVSLGYSLTSAFRSTSFLASLCGSYQAIIFVQRAVLRLVGGRDHKFTYWAAGFLSGWAILLENKHRRSELALFALPRAIDSLFKVLMPASTSIRTLYNCQVMMFCVSISAVMCLYDNESTRSCLSPMVVTIINRFLGNYEGFTGDRKKLKFKKTKSGTLVDDDGKKIVSKKSEIDLITHSTFNS